MRILFADDSEVVRHGIRSLLLSRDQWVVCGEAEDGAECIRKASDLRPDLILLDVMMRGLSGYRSTAKFAANESLLMSAQDSEILLPSAILAAPTAASIKPAWGRS